MGKKGKKKGKKDAEVEEEEETVQATTKSKDKKKNKAENQPSVPDPKTIKPDLPTISIGDLNKAVSLANFSLRGVIVAEVKTVSRHPKANNLVIVQVTDGLSDFNIVCSATNVTVGMKTAYAR